MAEQGIPVLQEHQAPELSSTNPASYTPTAEEKRAIALVNRLFDKAKKHRKRYDEKWLDYYKMFRGKQWKEMRPSYRHSEVINFVFQAIQSMVPILTDSRPKFDFMPEEPQDMEIAKILSEVAESDWEKNNWLLRLSEIIYDAHFYGTGIAMMDYNPEGRLGAGSIVFKSFDPIYCFPDPEARDVNDEEKSCRYFITAEPEDVEKLKKLHPHVKDYLKPDLMDLAQGDKTDLDQVRYKSPVDNKTVMEGTSAYELGNGDKALKLTAYILSDEFEEEEKKRKLPDGQEEVYYEQRLKYPTGRKICMASGVILSDGAIPHDDGMIPFARCVNYILPREFWGMSEVEQLESPQKIFNKLVSFALDVLTLMGNPIWVVDNSSGIDTDNLFNRPGLIVEKEPGTEVRREEGVQLQPYVLQLIDRMATWFDGISGANDVTRGVRPEGITAASAISSLQEAAQTRLRQKSRNIDAFLQSCGQLYKNRVFQYRTAPEIIRITGEQGATKYFKFYVEHGPDGQKKAVVRNYGQDPMTGQPVESLEAKEYVIRGDFDVRVTTGSSLPFAKTEKANLAFKLMEMGAIDRRELLKAVDYPNWEAVADRMDQIDQQKAQADAEAAQAEAAAKQGGGGAPAPQPQMG